MEWAKVMIKKNLADWKRVFLTGESKIKISGSDGQEEWLPYCTLGSVKTGGASIIWCGWVFYGPLAVVQGCITGATYSQTLQKFKLQKHLLPFLVIIRRKSEPNRKSQDDFEASEQSVHDNLLQRVSQR